MSQIKTLKRIFTRDYAKHVLAFVLASRRIMLTPIILGGVSEFLFKVMESLIGPAEKTVVMVDDALFHKLIWISVCMLAAGGTFLVAVFMSVWRLCIITRAYLLTPFETTTVSKREVFAKAIKEADLTLNHNKGKLSLKIICISLLQVPPLIVFCIAGGVLLLPFASGVMAGMQGTSVNDAAPELLKFFAQYQIPAAIVAILSVALMNSMIVVGGAKATLPNLSVWRSVVDSLVLSITHFLLISALSVPLLVISTFLQQPDILMQIDAFNRLPGLTEPPWVLFGRTLWQILVNQMIIPATVAVLLESIRVECLPKSVPGAVLSMEPEAEPTIMTAEVDADAQASADQSLVDAAPVETTSLDAAPIDATPIDAAPTDASIADIAMIDATPDDSAPLIAAESKEVEAESKDIEGPGMKSEDKEIKKANQEEEEEEEEEEEKEEAAAEKAVEEAATEEKEK